MLLKRIVIAVIAASVALGIAIASAGSSAIVALGHAASVVASTSGVVIWT
jgi:hypothetical protein